MNPLLPTPKRSAKRLPARKAGRTHRPRRLLLEVLEDRTVPAAIAPPSGLISWWTGDNTAADLQGLNSGALANGANYAAGKVGAGFNFDGNDDNFQAGTAGLPTGNADRTIELWARVDQHVAGEAFFASYGAPGSSNQVYTLGALSDGRVFASTWGPAITGPALQNGRWYHVAATNVGQSFKLYLDGVEVAAGTMSVNTPANSTFWMGRQTMTSVGDYRRLDGMVDEVSVYNRALSATEIQSIYNAGSDGKHKTANFFTADSPSVIEGAAGTTADVTFTIIRSGDLSGQVTVNWATANGTATAGVDYVANSGQVVFQDGESQKTVQVTVNGDATAEPHETFLLTLSTAAPGYAAFGGQATILTDDVAISVADATAVEGGSAYQFTGSFVEPDAYGLAAGRHVRVGADGNVYVASHDTDVVKVFEGNTGQFLRDLSTPGGELDGPWGMVFGPDGLLYVGGRYSHNIVRFDTTTGAYDVFVAPDSGGLGAAKSIAFGPTGDLYVGSQTESGTIHMSVKRFSGTTGAYLGDFVASGSGGLDGVQGVEFGPDGRLYVASKRTGEIKRYDGQTGAFIDNFVTAGSGGLSQPTELHFRNGYLYVGNSSPTVRRYNAATGAFVDVFVTSPVGTQIDGLAFAPSGEFYLSQGKPTLQAGSAVTRFAPSSVVAFTVTLSSASALPITVNYSTANGTATAGSDYTAVSGTLTFAPGQTSRTVLVQTANDATAEATETFFLNLSGAAGATLADAQGVGTITDDDATKFFVVDDGSTDRTYRHNPAGAAQGNTALGSGNTAPRGAASNAAGTRVWVVDANKKVYVYDAGGTLLGSWTAGSLASNAQVEGIAVDPNGTDVWIVDNKQGKVFKYAGAATRLSGSQNAASSFNLASGNGQPRDIVTDGTSLWVVNDAANDKVFKYTLTGTLLGSWTLNGGGGAPTGITLDPADVRHLWVVDSATDRVYQFDDAASRTSGSQSASANFALAAGNTNPQGIADPPPPAMLDAVFGEEIIERPVPQRPMTPPPAEAPKGTPRRPDPVPEDVPAAVAATEAPATARQRLLAALDDVFAEMSLFSASQSRRKAM